MICGTAYNYDWDGVRAYAHSLVNCGYTGEKVMFVHSLSSDAMKRLSKLGFTLVPFCPTPGLHHITTRWEPFLRYFAKRELPKWMVVTDVNDCVFQKNPFPWLIEHNYDFVAATESILVGEEATHNGWSDNMKWCVEGVGREAAESVADQEVCCHGTFGGRGDYLYEYINTLYAKLRVHKNPRLIDQGLGQWLIRQSPFSAGLKVPRPAEGWVLSGNFCWNSGMDPAPAVRRGIVYPNGDNNPFAIVHLTRHPRLATVVRRHWYQGWDGFCSRCDSTKFMRGVYGPRCLGCGYHYPSNRC